MTRPPRSMEEEISLSIRSIPFIRAVGVELVKADAQACHLTVPLEPRFRQNAIAPGLAAGLIAGVLDQLGSGSLTAWFGERHAKATLSMSLGFAADLSAEGALDFIGSTRFYTGTTGSVEMNAVTQDGRVLAHGLVEYMIGTYPGTSSGTSEGAVPHDHSRKAVRESFTPEAIEAEDFDTWMGITREDEASELVWAKRLTGSTGPVIAFHGGIVAAMAISEAQHRAQALGSLQLAHFTMEYLRAAKNETMTARTKIVRQTRRTAVLRTDIFQEAGERHVATATTRFVEAQ